MHYLFKKVKQIKIKMNKAKKPLPNVQMIHSL